MHLNLDLFANTAPPASHAALAAIETLASQDNAEASNVVFTRREVVDLAGYTPDQPLHERHLLAAWRGHGVGGLLVPQPCLPFRYNRVN